MFGELWPPVSSTFFLLRTRLRPPGAQTTGLNAGYGQLAALQHRPRHGGAATVHPELQQRQRGVTQL
jgi:hypothetical protein